MSRGHIICLKHLKRNCKCDSPKKISLHHSTRVPKDGKVNDWKEFIKWLHAINSTYFKTELDSKTIGTPLEEYYNKLKKKPIV